MLQSLYGYYSANAFARRTQILSLSPTFFDVNFCKDFHRVVYFDKGAESRTWARGQLKSSRGPKVGSGPAQIWRISGFVKSKIDGENAVVWSEK